MADRLAQQDASAQELARTVEALEREMAGVRVAPARGADAGRGDRGPAAQAAEIVQMMRSADTQFGVRWRTLSLGAGPAELAGAGAPGGGRDVAAMFAPLADAPQMQAARLRAEGEYHNLGGLLDMIDALKKNGAAITEIALEGEQVTMSGYVVARVR
ncbi:MAG TPA: hypothetical protein VMU33_09665 [Burkholderiaceae bacterium]|nr:hypothetical protein [Burkholderiaceae bacterium]